MKKFLFFFIIICVIFIPGCIFKVKSTASTPVAGVYKSFDKGNNWQPKRSLVVGGGMISIGDVNINKMVMDPSDNNAIYLITEGRGIIYTYSGGENWQQPQALSSGTVTSLAVDPKDKCIIFVTQANRILKSIDCSRNWSEIYVDTRSIEYSYIAIDSYDDRNIYASNKKGEIIKSVDAGSSWTTINRFNNPVIKILIDPSDTRIIYAATEKNGVFKSADGGQNWEDMSNDLKKYSSSKNVIDLIFSPSTPNSLIMLSKYGIIRTQDAGVTWEAVNLLTPPLSTTITSIAVNPDNDNELYYGTATTFYKTVDGGTKWITKRLPTAALSSFLLVDPGNPNIIYLGTKIIKKK